MPKLIRISLIFVAVALLGAGCIRFGERTRQPAAETQPEPQAGTGSEVAPAPTPVVPEAVIEYQDGLFNPSILRIQAGTKVTFKNRGSRGVWPASGMHPTHQICPGFDAERALKKGESYSFVFTEVKNCPFHNHIAPIEKGKIEVKAAE